MAKRNEVQQGVFRCKSCGRTFKERDSIEKLGSNLADHPLFVEKVIQALCKEYHTTIPQMYECVDCIQTRWERVLDDASFKPDDKGHYVLSDEDEYYGRRAD